MDKETVVDERGRYRFFSEEAFCNLTKAKDKCFVCLTARGTETQEHIIPNWIIKLCGLQNKSITLGNGNRIFYPKYKIPCCGSCNQALRHNYEDKISKAVKRGIYGIHELHESDPTIILRWLNLIFFKTHYKDFFVRRSLDRRNGEGVIGESYDWGVMELPHALLRSPVSDISLERPNIGSLYAIKLLNPDWADLWDYRDDIRSGAIYVRIRDIVLIGILNDAGLTSRALRGRFCTDGGAYVAQTLEILTDCQVFNFELKTKPDYIKCWNVKTDYTGIRVDLPENLDRHAHDAQQRHNLLWLHLERYENLLMDGGKHLKDFKKEILGGRISMALKPRPPTAPRDIDILSSLRANPDTATFYGR